MRFSDVVFWGSGFYFLGLNNGSTTTKSTELLTHRDLLTRALPSQKIILCLLSLNFFSLSNISCSGLAYHMRVVHGEGQQEAAEFICASCGRKFSSKNGLAYHEQHAVCAVCLNQCLTGWAYTTSYRTPLAEFHSIACFFLNSQQPAAEPEATPASDTEANADMRAAEPQAAAEDDSGRPRRKRRSTAAVSYREPDVNSDSASAASDEDDRKVFRRRVSQPQFNSYYLVTSISPPLTQSVPF